ncbi:uncharacterized protein LOC105833687 isoform X2 [Monomorium pharaonis]|uniref:uncharacterized protein LOC105833687 isoform X2 n=1 Tax=Monomorium pharaonis TaxID=307658 RepID=UPI001745EEDE|nr:uncharacterized protein LOC105833687 isoform X2 [Monomorium pharaonis]
MAMADGSIFDEEFKSESTIHKRKSLVFHTRFSVARDHDKDVNDEVITNGNRFASNKDEETCNTKNDIEAFNLKEYIEKLKQERKDWQQEYRKRKTQRRNLIKQKISMEEQGQILDINDVALRISTLSQNVHKLNRRFMERMESNIAKATVQVIKISEQ